MERNKSKWYIDRQKKKYEKMFNSKNEFIPIFSRALKKGDLSIFKEYIKEVDKIVQFEGEAWDALLDSPEFKNELIEFGKSVGIDGLKNKYGDKFGQKIQKMCDENKLKFLDIYQLVLVNADRDKADEISNLIDIFANEKLMAGIHRTGGSVSGDVINNEGLKLTGHLSSGVVKDIFEIQDLDENVSFYTSPGVAIAQISCGGNYKNLMDKENIDIAIIAIPKEDIEKTKDVILYGQTDVLNPRYVQGYVTVNSKENKILNCVQNSKFLDSDLISKSKIMTEEKEINNKLKEELINNTYDKDNVYMNYTTDKKTIKSDIAEEYKEK